MSSKTILMCSFLFHLEGFTENLRIFLVCAFLKFFQFLKIKGFCKLFEVIFNEINDFFLQPKHDNGLIVIDLGFFYVKLFSVIVWHTTTYRKRNSNQLSHFGLIEE